MPDMQYRNQTCCWAGKVAYPEPCPEGHLSWNVAFLIGLANLHGTPTLSMDDDYPPEMLETASGWFSTAVMEWRTA